MMIPKTANTFQMISLLKLSGLWFNRNNRSLMGFYSPLFRVIVLTLVCLAAGFSAYVLGFKESLKGVSFFFPCLFIINVQTIIALIKNDELKRLLTTLDNCTTDLNDNWQISILNKGNYLAWNIIKLYKYALFIVWLFYFTIPPIVDITIYIFGYDIRVFTLILPFSGYMDINPPRSLKNCLLLILTIFWSTISFLSHIGFLGTFVALIMYTHSILKIFNVSNKFLKFKSNYKSLIKLINIHQNIIKISEGLKDFYGMAFIIQNILVSLCVCMCLLTASTTEDKSLLMAYTFGFFYYFSVSGVCCFLGQLIENESNKMNVTISNIPWYEMPPQIRKDITLILLQANRLITISYKGKSPLNFATLTKIANTSYSYFMLLRSVI